MRRLWIAIVIVFASVPSFAADGPSTAPATFYGRVVNRENQPVQGAKIWLSAWDVDSVKVKTTAVSDADGRFQIAEVPPYAQLLARADGYGLTPAVTAESTLDEPAEIKLKSTASARIQLIGPDGKPAADVRVLIGAINEPRNPATQTYIYANMPEELRDQYTQTTDASGTCVIAGLPAGNIVIPETSDDRFAKLTYESNIQLLEQPVTEGKAIKLDPAAALAGTVIYADTGNPAAGVAVSAQISNQNTGGRYSYGYAKTDAEGKYVIKQILGGQYNLSLSLDKDLSKFTAVALASVAAVAGETKSGNDFKLITGSIIRGKVTVRETSAPVPDIYISVQGPAHPRNGGSVQSAQTGKDGTYEMHVPPGAQYVYIQSAAPAGLVTPTQRTKTITVAADQTATADFTLTTDKRPAAMGKVVDTDGKPVARAMISADSQDDEMPSYFGGGRRVTSDAEGKFTIPATANGATLRARKGEHWATTRPVTLSAQNRNELTLVLQKDAQASLLVKVQQADGSPVAGARVDLTQQATRFSFSVARQTSGPDGTAVFQTLNPDQTYSVSASAKGFGRVSSAKLNPAPATQAAPPPIVLPKADSFVAGIVMDAAGEPVPGLKLGIYGRTSESQNVTTDESGHFNVSSIVAGDQLGINSLDETYTINNAPPIPAGTDSAVIVATKRKLQ